MFTTLFFFTTSYLMSTIEEWFIHKYLMHNKAILSLYNNHITHHAKTNPDYSINDSNLSYICVDVSSLNDIIQIFFVFSINSGILYVLFNPYISLLTISCTVSALLGINILLWNTYHSYIHKLDGSKICNFPKGLSKNFIDKYFNENNIYVKWIINNHKQHHNNCRTNFNIVFPGGDYLFGTYKETMIKDD